MNIIQQSDLSDDIKKSIKNIKIGNCKNEN